MKISSLDYVPFASMIKGIYYLGKSFQLDHRIKKASKALENMTLESSDYNFAKTNIEYYKDHSKYLRHRALLTFIPFVGNSNLKKMDKLQRYLSYNKG